MRRNLVPVLVALLLGALSLQVPGAGSDTASLLEFDQMAPVVGPYVGSANPIRGINGGGLPWQISRASGEVTTGGRIEVEVRGLVLFDGPPVPPDRQGVNPAPSFVAVVSCLTIVDGAPATANVATGPFPATPSGDSKIEQRLTLPSPCFAPIVFVGPSAATWFAITGQL